MKNLLTLLLILSSIASYSQSKVSRGARNNTNEDYRVDVLFNLYVPRYTDTTAANANIGIDSCGAKIFTYNNGKNKEWTRYCSPKRWVLTMTYENLILTTQGTAGPATLNRTTGVLNIPNYAVSGGSGGTGSPTLVTWLGNQYSIGNGGSIILPSPTTTQVIEAANLYFTVARARGALSLTTNNSSGAATYDPTTGKFNIPNYTYNLPIAGTNLGGVRVNGTTGIIIDPSTGQLSVPLLTPRSVPFVGNNGLLTENNQALNFDGTNLNAGTNNPVAYSGITLNNNRGAILSSDSGTIVRLGNNSTVDQPDIKKKFFINNLGHNYLKIETSGTPLDYLSYRNTGYANMDWLPSKDNYYDLGNASLRWRYINGRHLNVDSITINGITYTTIQKPISLTTTGSIGPATFNPINGVLNIPNYSLSSGGNTTNGITDTTDMHNKLYNSIYDITPQGDTALQYHKWNGQWITVVHKGGLSGSTTSTGDTYTKAQVDSAIAANKLRFGIEDNTSTVDRVVDMLNHELTFNNIKGIRTDGNILFPHDPNDNYVYGMGQLNSANANNGAIYATSNNYLSFDGNSTDNFLNAWAGSQDNNSNRGFLQINGYHDRANLNLEVLSNDNNSSANAAHLELNSDSSSYPFFKFRLTHGNSDQFYIASPYRNGVINNNFILPLTVNNVRADSTGNITIATGVGGSGSAGVTSVAKGFGIKQDSTITGTGMIAVDTTVINTKASFTNAVSGLQSQITANGTAITADGTKLTQDSTYLKGLIDGKLSSNQPITITATGDATGISTSSPTAPSLPLTLATVNSNVGTFTNATVTVDAKGRVTGVSTGSAGNAGTVTSVATNTGTGITGGTITSTGTLAIDTFKIDTRANRDKLKDSLQANINVNISNITTNTSNIATNTTNISNNTSSIATLQNKKVVAVTFSGTDTKTLTLTLNDGTTITGTFTDISGSSTVGWTTLGNVITSNSITATPEFIGTTNPAHLIIKTNNQARMVVDSAGYVTINAPSAYGGTTYRLVVGGAISTTSLGATGSVGGSSGNFTFDIHVPAIYGSFSSNGTLTLVGNAGNGNTATNANIYFKTGNGGNTTAGTVLNNGSWSIGSSTLPHTSSIFDVNSAANSQGSKPWPVMTKANRDAIASPEDGLTVKVSDNGGYLSFYNTATSNWQKVTTVAD